MSPIQKHVIMTFSREARPGLATSPRVSSAAVWTHLSVARAQCQVEKGGSCKFKLNPGTACTVDVDGCFVMVAGGYLTDNGYQTPTIFTRGCCWAVPRQKVKV